VRFSDEAVYELSNAIFRESHVWVAEAYSEFDKPPRAFNSSGELLTYFNKTIADPKSLAFVFVAYPDMAGLAKLRTIQLDQSRVKNAKFRYTWEGWGLISIKFPTHDKSSSISNYINALSEKRALAWSTTSTITNPPSSWNWAAVERHKRRLQRVLKTHA
jgi:hypothetical protein